MRDRNTIFFLLFFLFSLSVSAQDFISLKWQNPFESKRITFNEAHFLAESQLPHYIQNIDLGTDYLHSFYDVKIEYPEFEPLDKKESLIVLNSKENIPAIPEIKKRLVVSAKRGILEVIFLPIVLRDGKYQRLKSFKLSLLKSSIPQTRSMLSANSFVPTSRMATGKWVKIRVSDTGVYKITNSELLKMGFSDPANVKLFGYGGHLLPESFLQSKIDDLPEIPLWRENSFVLFYANGVIKWSSSNPQSRFSHTNNCYSTYGYYFLAEDGTVPLEFPKKQSVPNTNGARQVVSFDDYALYEKDSYNWTASGRELYDSYDFISGNKRDYPFSLPGITAERAICKVAFAAASSTPTTLVASINSKEYGRMPIDAVIAGDSYNKAQVNSASFSWDGDKTEKTIVSLTHNRDAGASGRLDYIEINYRRALSLSGNFTSFRDLGSLNNLSTYILSNAHDRVRVWDVTSPDSYSQMMGSLSGSNFSFSVNTSTLKEFVAVNLDGTFKGVEVVGNVPNQNLHALEQCDMVIIVPSNGTFFSQAERLAEAHRSKDNMVVHVVTADQIYNEFSSGTPDVTAYRWFMKMFYDRAVSSVSSQVKSASIPRYLLLFGDCAWDNRMTSPAWKGYSPEDFLLCYQSKNSTWETYSYITDDYIGLLDNQDGASLEYDGMDIGVGRFPVRTIEQATQVVDKTIAYMNNKEVGPWKNSICYVADDGDNHLHMGQAEELALFTEKNNPEFVINRIYADAYKWEATATGHTYKQANKKLMELFNEGMLMVNYTGHGGVSGWSAEALLTTPDVLSLRSPRLPLWVTATCDFCRYDDVTTSAGELALLNPQGGGIALFTTTRVVYAQNNSSLNKVFCKYVFSKRDGERLRLGDIMRLSKCDAGLSGDLNKLKFSLIGDPALMLAYPDYKVIVDEFNGKPSFADDLSIQAGSKVQVKGHVADSNGNVLTDFNGKVYPTVFDAKETITTLNNDGTGRIVNPSDPKDIITGGFTFSQRSKKLFSGSGAVESGTFSFTFPVPKDINYANQAGLLNFYAAENQSDREAQGAFDHFLIGGTEPGTESTDGIGPKINLYLNTPDFIYGGQTNQTPYLVVELEDIDGINTVGNGVGHDIVATIDNSPNYSFVLNNYYESVFGDYTKGVVRYLLPTLPEGKHSLFFRAWDVQNNSSFTTLNFEVVNGLKPGLFNLECTKSPAKENTTFVLTHDRPQEVLDVTIQVYDFSGRVLWTKKESGISPNNYYYVDWNLTSNGGQRIAPGVYLYRASISSRGSEESTQAKKIVILGQ